MLTPSILASFWSRAALTRLVPFSNLLKGEPEAAGHLYLRDASFSTTQPDSPPHLNGRVYRRSWAELGRTRPRFRLLCAWNRVASFGFSEIGPRQFPSY